MCVRAKKREKRLLNVQWVYYICLEGGNLCKYPWHATVAFRTKKKPFRVLCRLKMRLTTSSTKDEGRFWIINKIKPMHSRTDDASRQEAFDKGANVVKYITDIV